MNRARNRDRKSDRWLSRIRRVWITAGLVFTVVFTGWSLWAYRADADAHAARKPADRRARHRHRLAAVVGDRDVVPGIAQDARGRVGGIAAVVGDQDTDT